MTGLRWLPAALLLWSVAFVPAVRCQQEERAPDWINMDGTATLPPSRATLAIWTDKPGYLRRHGWPSVYLAVEGVDHRRLYREFIYLENIVTGRRQYLVRDPYPHLRDEIVDVRGHGPRLIFGTPGTQIDDRPPTRVWRGPVLEPGLWQFVAELRSPDTTEIVKRAYAKFVVSATRPEVLGRNGRDTEISRDTTWTRDRIYALRHQVFVNAGATLTIEPGTLVLGRGQQAVIVVEPGGRIEARGRPDAPIVMTCDAPVGQRQAGCWGGVVVLGRAPMARGTDLAAGIVPESRARYGGDDRGDSSGVLQYVRVEFAGAGLALRGVGSGTLIDHVQVHASAADGIQFSGGTVNCTYCVASGAAGSALAWSLGWQGTAQHVFLQSNPEGGGYAVEGRNDRLAFDAWPRSAPTLFNLTAVGDLSSGAGHGRLGGGILLGSGSAVTARNLVVMGFGDAAVDARDNSPSLFSDGTSSMTSAILYANGARSPNGQIVGGIEGILGYQETRPMLVNVAYRANPDPRPLLGSPARRVGAGAVPPSNGMLDTSAQYIGAFGDSNWLEEWTFFGPESDYDTREQGNAEDRQ